MRLMEVTWESSRQGESKLRFKHSETYRMWRLIYRNRNIAIVGNNRSLEMQHRKVVGTLVADTGLRMGENKT